LTVKELYRNIRLITFSLVEIGKAAVVASPGMDLTRSAPKSCAQYLKTFQFEKIHSSILKKLTN
jgi:uncharacterized protein YbbK (DUF523 family)